MDAGSTSGFIMEIEFAKSRLQHSFLRAISVRNLRTMSILQTSRSFQPPGPSRKTRSDGLACDLRSDVEAKLV